LPKIIHPGVISLGYVGLPLRLFFLRKSIKVNGFDFDLMTIANIETEAEIYQAQLSMLD
jgi:UDP-N-acetyl-D-mannosaminuronate dehydrogenase